MYTQWEHKLKPYDKNLHEGYIYASLLSGVEIPATFNGERFIGFGETKFGYGAVCVLDVDGTEYVAEPHVTWFPWVPIKSKINGAHWTFKHLAEKREVFLTVEKSQKKFYEYFVKLGILRKIGFINNLPVVDEVHMYQYERNVECRVV